MMGSALFLCGSIVGLIYRLDPERRRPKSAIDGDLQEPPEEA